MSLSSRWVKGARIRKRTWLSLRSYLWEPHLLIQGLGNPTCPSMATGLLCCFGIRQQATSKQSLFAGCLQLRLGAFLLRLHAKPLWMVITRSLDQPLTVSTWLLKCLSVEPRWQLNSYIKCCLSKNHFSAMSACEKLGESSYFPAGISFFIFRTVPPGLHSPGNKGSLRSLCCDRTTWCYTFVTKTARTYIHEYHCLFWVVLLSHRKMNFGHLNKSFCYQQ